MRCLITGINGVVGSNLANILRQQYGWDILGIGTAAISAHPDYQKIDLTNKDDVERVPSILGTCDLVIHCAAIINYNCDPVEIMTTNVIGSMNALNISKRIKARQFINISSVPVIGKILTLPITEDHPCNPNTIYHLSKKQAEEVLMLLSGSEINTASLRIPSPVGLGMVERSFLPIILSKAKNNEGISITGDKKRRQNFLDLRDLALAIVNISKTMNVQGIYNIASKTPVSNLTLAQIVVDTCKSQSQINDHTDEGGGYYEDWNISLAKAKKDFSFEPIYQIDDTLDWLIKGAEK